jgi:polysaccharide deacetylase 2 family uncharacterized protein YibQ
MRSSMARFKKWRWKGWMGYVFSFFLGFLLILGGYAYLVQKKPPTSEVFSQKIFIADQIIQGQLYKFGISEKDVLLRQTSSKKESNLAWQQSFLKIQIPKTLPFSLIEKNFEKSVSALGKPFSLQFFQGSDSLQLEIKVMDRVTHQLTFLYSKPLTLRSDLRPKVAIVIDDLGGENHLAQELLRWDIPLTFSILPFTPYSKTLALEAHQKGKETILHLPMEPQGYPKVKPGEGVLLYEMNKETLLAQLSKDIEAIPYIKGVSNHMGSRVTRDPEKMRIILSELKRRGLFYLDSRTTHQTVGLQTAKSIGLQASERSLFLDHSLNEDDIRQKIEQLVRLSLSTGKAIGIGHPHSATLKSLKEMIPKMKEKGIEFVSLSSMME